ncbi:dihydropteroate synthase [Ichthyenterobacterium sp. W332]|uniref:dihydropteroate synthase n=1 Tax=Microcosmobacter mediterraneus TaxID=3075607 RepID=A0ABU2YFQ6_9FLAO|nr:dihydropteroate synthase [Ichthyenterobacterium sp. W332]MDT0557018.1 dihydropteroate synthase [Ichthyenterobacterium sp. W332]
MGILNLTPDSFYDGGRFRNSSSVMRQVDKMLEDGATFIDIGAYSSKPNAKHVSEDEEMRRILSVVNLVVNSFPEIVISIDTFRSSIAKQCIEAGAAIINDISAGLLDNNMLSTIAKFKVPYIMMHMRGTPQTMQTLTDYNDLIKDILFYFSERITKAKSYGIIDIICDPGFGFAKTKAQNFELLNHLELFKSLDLPILSGISRKSMIYNTLEFSANEALNGTTALNMVALEKGTSILRVHDVKEAMECVTLYNALHNQ